MSCLKMLEKRTTERTAGFGVRFREFLDGLISLSCQFSIGRLMGGTRDGCGTGCFLRRERSPLGFVTWSF
jgi:hypothetical protein